MWTGMRGLVRGIVEDVQRHALVEQLRRMDDHLLHDIGLRRGQLDTLLLRPPAARTRTAGGLRRTPAVRPSLQGCG